MARTLSLLGLLLIYPALIDRSVTAQDAKAVLHAVAKNIGAETLRCLTYSGSGYVGVVEQNFTPRHDWPRFELASKDVQANACGEAIRAPESVQTATVPPVRVESQKLADGVSESLLQQRAVAEAGGLDDRADPWTDHSVE